MDHEPGYRVYLSRQDAALVLALDAECVKHPSCRVCTTVNNKPCESKACQGKATICGVKQQLRSSRSRWLPVISVSI